MLPEFHENNKKLTHSINSNEINGMFNVSINLEFDELCAGSEPTNYSGHRTTSHMLPLSDNNCVLALSAKKLTPNGKRECGAGEGAKNDLQNWLHLGDLYTESGQTLQGSFSPVPKPIFASEYSCESSRRDVHNTLLRTAL